MELQKRTKVINILISIFSILLVFVALYKYAGFIFLTNDDLILKSIVSGELTGTPDAHMIYSHYFLGLVLSGLYTLTDKIPWYGMYLIFSFAGCLMLILYRLLYRCKKVFLKAVITIFFCIITIMLLARHIAMIQYTVVAGMAGATAIFWTLTINMNEGKTAFRRNVVVTIFLEGLCFLIREKVFFMLIPFAACMWLSKWLLEKRKKEINFRYGIFIGTTAILIVILLLTDRVAYKDAGWSLYKSFNSSREQIYDYYGFPDYTQNKLLYEKLEISEASYMAASENYMLLLEDSFNADSMKLLADKARQQIISEQTLWKKARECVSRFAERNKNYMDRPINIVVYLLYILLALGIIVTKKYEMYLEVGALLFSRMAVWCYVIWQGRFPERITQSLYIVEILILLTIFMKLEEIRTLSKKYLYVAVGLILFLSMYLGIPKLQAVKGENAGKIYFGIAYEQVKEYAMENPEKFYLLDMNSFSSYTQDVFNNHNYKGLNGLLMGSWLPGSPLVQKRLKLAGIDDIEDAVISSDNIYIIFGDNESTSTDYLSKFYKEKYQDSQFVVVDQFITDVDISFVVGKEK